MKLSVTLVTACSLFLFIFSSCTKNIDTSEKKVTQERAVGHFSGIENDGPFQVRLVLTPGYSLSLTGDENILSEVETRVINGILRIGYRRINQAPVHSPIVITVSAQALSQFFSSGGGQMESEDEWVSSNALLTNSGSGKISLRLKSSKVKAHITGAGEIHLAGSSDMSEYFVSGSGRLHAYGLESVKTAGSIKGSGRCEVYVSEELAGSIAGSGSIYYRGDPKAVDVSISGTGRLIKEK